MFKPAIVVVGYNRPKQTLRLLQSIGNAKYECEDITLVISIDQSNLSDEVEKVANSFEWKYGDKIIRRFSERQGLRRHIVSCGDLSEKYGAVIILEDDLFVAKDFYTYTCHAHDYYSSESSICGISLYSFRRIPFTNYSFLPIASKYDTFLGQMVVTWGQSWTRAQWGRFKTWYLAHEDKLPEDNVKIPDEISGWKRSWGKYFSAFMAEKKLFYVYPYFSRTTCFSDIGEHNSKLSETAISQVPLMEGDIAEYRFAPIAEANRYDSFYEFILPEKFEINGIYGKDISLDLNGMKRHSMGRDYLLSCQNLDFKVVKSFGLAMRPVENNILYYVPGEYFKLYKIPDKDKTFHEKNKKGYRYRQSYERLRYEHNDMTWRLLVYYTTLEIVKKIRTKLKSR